MWPLSLMNEGPISIIQLQCFEMVSKKRRDNLINAWCTMEFIRCPLILKVHPRNRKISMPRLKSKLKYIVYLLKNSMMHCFRIGKKHAPILRPLTFMLNFEVDRLSLQQLEYTMDRSDLPNDNFFWIEYCGRLNFPNAHIQLNQDNKLIISYLQEEDHQFIYYTHKKVTIRFLMYYLQT